MSPGGRSVLGCKPSQHINLDKARGFGLRNIVRKANGREAQDGCGARPTTPTA
jgi:hypothetical protein